MNKTPHTAGEMKEMLSAVGASSLNDLFKDISFPEPDYKGLPDGISEFELIARLKDLAASNSVLLNFSGGGFYDHLIPAVVDSIVSKPEFYTAYTPYQPECSQGTLQAIYEYQSAICRLTGMSAANASVYDGATALAESILMAVRIKGREKIVIDETVNPLYRRIVKTYLQNTDCLMEEVPMAEGFKPDIEALEKKLDDNTACLVLQNPNYFGTVTDFSALSEKAHAAGALMLGSFYPLSLGILKTPAEMDFDIVSGEGQSLGNPLSFGGPYFGFMSVKKEYIRKLPGRIVGATCDDHGRRGYVLTLQAREQHIRRHKATSNICTNQNHCSLRSLVFLCCYGRDGFAALASENHKRALQLKGILSSLGSVNTERHSAAFFNEFVIELPEDSAHTASALLEKGILPGIPLGKYYPGLEKAMLLCATEKTSEQDMIKLSGALKELGL